MIEEFFANNPIINYPIINSFTSIKKKEFDQHEKFDFNKFISVKTLNMANTCSLIQ